MTEEIDVRRIKDRERHGAYFASDAGKAARQRYNEERQQGYQMLVAQGVPRAEAKRNGRRALKALLAAELARQAQEGGDS